MDKKKQTKKPDPTLFIILDGFGLADFKEEGNAITPESAPHIFEYMDEYPSTTLTAHGEAVGLFPGQTGNSEAGHFNLGAGRVVKQDLVRITEAIHDGTFFKNEAFKQALHHAKKYGTKVHLMGLLTDGNSAHATPEHLFALLDYFRKAQYDNVYLHLFTDGRDAPPHSAITFLKELRRYMKNGEAIATICGRFYAMDRNKLWDRTEKAYNMIVCGKGECSADTAEEAIAQAYNRGETDEYICPTVIKKNGKPVATVEDNDIVVFFNTRSDRARQLTKAFVQPDFQKKNPKAFKRKKFPENIRFVAMTDFGPDLPGIFTAFPTADLKNTLPCVIDKLFKQKYISEREKYAHVTYFMNGGYADAVCGEDREVFQSKDVYSFAKVPEMSAPRVTKLVKKAFEKEGYSFVAVNYPNADMVGHTGDFSAAKRAVYCVDEQVHELVDFMLKRDGQLLITADHGNAELMIDPKTKEIMTEHTTNPVPCIIIGKKLKGKTLRKGGKLADVAPTILDMVGLDKPEEMTGKSLLS